MIDSSIDRYIFKQVSNIYLLLVRRFQQYKLIQYKEIDIDKQKDRCIKTTQVDKQIDTKYRLIDRQKQKRQK